VILQVKVPEMAFGRDCLICDAASVVRPHVPTGTAKAAADAWEPAEAFEEQPDIAAALSGWEPGQLKLRPQAARADEEHRPSAPGRLQLSPSEPERIFGIYEPGR
jgi:2,6-dihydroxypyridine 3-monooxygenase